MFGDRDCLPLSLSLKKSLTPNKSSKMKQAVISSNAQLAVALREWWHAKSESMSEMIGEDCTHGEVVMTNLVFTAGMVAIAILGTMFSTL